MSGSRGDGRRLLAAPVLGEHGGGIGQVSGLLWDAMRDTWPDRVDLVTLLGNGHSRPHAADKLRFGVELAGRRWLARPQWILFSHMGLARIERYVPSVLHAPYAVFLHGIEAWRPLGAREQDVLRRATLRIANSAFTAREAANANPNLGEIAVCPLALPKAAAAYAAGRTPPPAADLEVLVVGRLAAGERYKGHEQLIRAWRGVVDRVPGARLVVAGDGDDAPRLKRLAVEAGVGDLVRFTGFLTRQKLEDAYARAAMFALPSRGEGFGLVYLEAMAHGLACLGSTHDAASEVIANGETGALVDPGDSDALGRAIADLLESPAQRRAMGEAGRRRVDQLFRYEGFRRRATELLEEAFEVDRRPA
jgi:phosphatidylinositol alpha-1,6-mannosyltransferase